MNKIYITLLIVLLTISFVDADLARVPKNNFTGLWDTTYGDMTLTQKGNQVSGYYIVDKSKCIIKGKIEKNKLVFTYQESNAQGEGWFQLSEDRKSFIGKWREKNKKDWGKWTGKRRKHKELSGFEGLWETSFGRLRIMVDFDKAYGRYNYKNGSLEGEFKTSRFEFTYKDEAKGEGWFQLADDKQSFAGKWKAANTNKWKDWTGKRVKKIPGRTWLVILEVRWEENLSEQEYSFGSMLRAFFNRDSDIATRHRFFSTEKGLQHWCAELIYLAEPIVLVISSHGTDKGLEVGGKIVNLNILASALKDVRNIKLTHFSSCQIMLGDVENKLLKKLKQPFPVSGYTTSVDWAGSAVIEFLYFDLILVRGMSPEKAAKQVLKLIPFAGDKDIPDGALKPAGFRQIKINGK